MRQLKMLFSKILMFCAIAMLWACTSTPEIPEKPVTQQAQNNTPATPDPHIIEGTFVAPGVDFARYRRLIVAELGLNEIDVSVPAKQRSDTSWVLTNEDKSFLRSEYTHAVVGNLIADGTYTTAINPAEDVLLVKSRIVQIAAGKPAAAEKNEALTMYNEGAAEITISMELFDSMTHRLIGTITDSRDLGHMQINNNRVAANVLIRQAFIDWLKTLRTELDTLSGRQSPLEKYLR
ncbi:DUF3313 family protein [Cellvibrio sp. ARAG 10.3]|uniref:DUF3313 family protein n=1 Tax=Cellvibrio sp. ARAG 10.3 TaxID=3451358 RepID=UPI003F473A1E